jgi:4-amino-4-deoxy-L-arabinose transferase-like glycosyltransferase
MRKMHRLGLTSRVRESFLGFVGYVKRNPLVFLAYSVIFGIGVFLRFLVGRDYGSLQYDEAAHSVGGIFFSRLFVGSLQHPGDYLAGYSGMVVSFWFYPYGYSFLASLGYLLFGFSESAARLPSVVFSILLIHATVCVAKEVELEEKVGLFSAFFVATSSIIVIVGTGAMVDVPVTVLITYSLLFWVKGLKSRGGGDLLKAGILGGLAGLMKPTGIFVLIFMVIFEFLVFLFSGDKLVLSRSFWRGILGGFLVFSTWWASAFLVDFLVDGWIGEEAIKGVTYWFDFFGVFGKYVPPWYSPPWYKIEAWAYYPDHLLFAMGILPFVFVFVGAFARLKKVRLVDVLLILFALGFYVLQTFASNKNPRYILPILPILYVYASVGLGSAFSSISEEKNLSKSLGHIRKTTALLMIILVLVGGFLPLQSALEVKYTPGMGYGFEFPIRESLQIVMNDGEGGLIMLDTQDNLFNLPVVTFYLASVDENGLYGCHYGLSVPSEILNFTFGGKRVKYVLVMDVGSNIGRYVCANPEFFELLGKAENNYGNIYVYKVKG